MRTKKTKKSQTGKFSGLKIINHDVAYFEVLNLRPSKKTWFLDTKESVFPKSFVILHLPVEPALKRQ